MVHLMIIWSNALMQKDYIIKEINKDFRIIQSFNIKWDKKRFKDNLAVFYSHSLKDKSSEEASKIIKNKCKRVGDGTFYALVFEDSIPNLVERETTSGIRTVNAHVFDKKIAFRKLTGGGSLIHSSDDEWETNKDLTLLFELNLPDFLKKYDKGTPSLEYFNKNCLGIGGYESIQQLFYVLNNTIKYCVLRNHECIPDEYTVEGHGDIDLLVEHRNYAVRLTKALPVYPQKEYRVYHIIKIAGKDIPFDFRFVGDNYYDPKWENDILETRVMQKNLFYTPNSMHQYYSLLYHAYVQKPYVKNDYFAKLSMYASKADVEYKESATSSIQQLNRFIEDNNYKYVQPYDKTVFYNNKNLNSVYVWNCFKKNVAFSELKPILENNYSLSNFYYFKGKYEGREVFIKYGGIGETCLNEYERTRKVFDLYPQHFVEPIAIEQNDRDYYIISEWVDSVSIEDYLKNATQQQISDIKQQLIEIYNALLKADVMHRDIRPDNLLVTGNTLKLIDFQYALDRTNPKELSCVLNETKVAIRLGNRKFRYKGYAWRDSSSILKIMKHFGMDTSDVKLSPDKVYYMPLLKYYEYNIHRLLRKILKVLKNCI